MFLSAEYDSHTARHICAVLFWYKQTNRWSVTVGARPSPADDCLDTGSWRWSGLVIVTMVLLDESTLITVQSVGWWHAIHIELKKMTTALSFLTW